MKTLTLKIEISDKAYQLLLDINRAGCAEYRDSEYENLEEFKNDIKSHNRTDEWFLNRNFGGTFYLTKELLEYGLIEEVYMAWHLTFKLTDNGEEMIKQNEV